jgi:XRE family transcriptional regulator, aerobic/anaerobic benzoate catabolism transcriptional regulator
LKTKGSRKRSKKTIDPLKSLGDRVRQARARRGMTRKQLARDSGVSERYLAQIESGHGNISVLILRQLAKALNVAVDVLLFESPEPAVDLVHTVEFLRRLSLEELALARRMLLDQFGGVDPAARHRRIALIGLRGAGKSTLGRRLAEHLGMAFIELDREVEREGRMELSDIFTVHGQEGYRQLERAALQRVVSEGVPAVIAAGGGIVAEPQTLEFLLATCVVVWLRASPEEHMRRVQEQGDLRPMRDSRRAMDDLRAILASREALYAKADFTIDTSGRGVAATAEELLNVLERTMAAPG